MNIFRVYRLISLTYAHTRETRQDNEQTPDFRKFPYAPSRSLQHPFPKDLQFAFCHYRLIRIFNNFMEMESCRVSLFALIQLFLYLSAWLRVINSSFLFTATQYPIMWIYHHLFKRSPDGGHLACFQCMARTNKNAMNARRKAFIWPYSCQEKI